LKEKIGGKLIFVGNKKIWFVNYAEKIKN
jgi:hypothetical protein